MDAATPPDLDRPTTYTRIYRQTLTATTTGAAPSAAAAFASGAFGGLLADSMLARDDRGARPDAPPLPERRHPSAAEPEAAAADRRDEPARVAERRGTAGDVAAEAPSEPAADRPGRRTPQAERDAAASDANERPKAPATDASTEADVVPAAPAATPPASVETVEPVLATFIDATAGEALEPASINAQEVGPTEVGPMAGAAAAAAATATATASSATPAAGAPGNTADAGVPGADRRAAPETAESAPAAPPTPAAPARPATVQTPAPAPAAGDPAQPQPAAGNAGAAADPRLAQAAIGVSKDADALRSSPLSSLIATSEAVVAAASETTQQRRRATTGNAAAGQHASAAVKPGSALPGAAAAAAGPVTGQPATLQPAALQPGVQPGAQPPTSAALGGLGATPGADQRTGERPPLPSAGLGAGLPASEGVGDGAAASSQGRFADALRAELKAEHAAGPAPRKPGLGDQVSVHITKAIKNGIDRIDIQLKPQSLGRVDVHLEMASDGRVTATVTAETRHALELLQNDSRALEQALQQAGLKTDSNSLNFNLRGQANSHGEPRGSHGGGRGGAGDDAGFETESDADGGWSADSPGAAGAGRLDIRA